MDFRRPDLPEGEGDINASLGGGGGGAVDGTEGGIEGAGLLEDKTVVSFGFFDFFFLFGFLCSS